MSEDDLRAATAIVNHAESDAEKSEEARTAGFAKTEAIKRVAARPRTGFGRFAFDNGLALVATALFALAFIGQILTGRAEYNNDQRVHDQEPVSIGEYLTTGAFVEATSENWESEFLQMGIFVLLTVFFYQRGSSESKKID